jgi:hypothetical protein
MKNMRVWFSLAVLGALLSTGCFLVSLQKLITFVFDDPVTIAGPTALYSVPVDLNTEEDYVDNKDKLKDVADLALLGRVTNLSTTATSVEVWMVASPGTPLTTESAVQAAGIKVWGTLSLGASETKTINWNESAKLFVGRQALINEIKGDGRFDLYAIGSGTAYNFRINKGALAAVLSAGQ